MTRARSLGALLGLALAVTAPVLGAQSPAARSGDLTSEGLQAVAGDATVLIGGRPAARTGDAVQCFINAGFPPVPTPSICTIGPGSSTVRIGGLPAARVGSVVIGSNRGVPTIVTGSQTVLIGD